jgi:RNA polymerase sigma-70 factor (ECF subfamily)
VSATDSPERGGNFPATHWSAIEGARSSDPEQRRRAFDRIVSIYWKPIYKYVRARYPRSAEDAQDLTQEFFASLIDRGTLDAYEPRRARLRTFLRSCVDALVANTDRDARRLKRGGGSRPLSLEFELAEGELARTGLPSPDRLDDFFEKEWARSLFAAAVEQLRAHCSAKGKEVVFALFERYDLDDAEPGRPTYADLAREYAISTTDVTNHLAGARREFRRISLDLLRETTASDDEFRREARSLLGHAPE